MRCDEIQERFVDLLYNERGTPAASPELVAHLNSCPTCQGQLEGLRAVQGALRLWSNEAPVRHVTIPATPPQVLPFRPRVTALRIGRYAAIAAMVTLAFLALANAEIMWNERGFTFRTHLWPGVVRADYYTKNEMRDILIKVLDQSEDRLTETNRLMMLRMLETIEQQQQRDLLLLSNKFSRMQSHN